MRSLNPKSKNTALIHNALRRRLAGPFAIAILICLAFGKLSYALSIITGGFFSYLIFLNLLKSPEKLRRTQTPSAYFPDYLIRLALYIIPVALCFSAGNRLHVGILLLCLFSFQVILVLSEGIRSYRHFRKRLER